MSVTGAGNSGLSGEPRPASAARAGAGESAPSGVSAGTGVPFTAADFAALMSNVTPKQPSLSQATLPGKVPTASIARLTLSPTAGASAHSTLAPPAEKSSTWQSTDPRAVTSLAGKNALLRGNFRRS